MDPQALLAATPEILPASGGLRSARLLSCLVSESPESSYRPRTLRNARADITAAFALDFSTGGERLTASAAGDRLAAYSLLIDPSEAGRRLKNRLLQANAKSLNVAGNGAHTLSRRGWTQAMADAWIFECLSAALPGTSVSLIRSGGQTGADFSGAACSLALGIPSIIEHPRGFLRRRPDGSDFESDPSAILLELRSAAIALLAPAVPPPSPSPRP